ncbi:MAG TPA: glycosyltransferase family 39 protein, partial [Anaerolineales bacterium]
IGLGVLGLLGLGVSALQLATAPFLTAFQIVLATLLLLTQEMRKLGDDLNALSVYRGFLGQYSLFTKLAVLSPLLFSFLLTLTPPFEAFDALSYHLAQPARILQDGGLRPVDIPAFWYPNLTENVYLWPLAMGSDRAAQIIHLAWAILSIVLLWHWTVQTWGAEIGRKTLLLIASLASLPLISSWVYADMALVYYSVAALYALHSYETAGMRSSLYTTGLMAGLAMSVKYTSFVLPLTCGLLLLFRTFTKERLKVAFVFSCIAVLTALPWYLRNAVIMHNPFYPFVFDGLYWDAFRREWYANAGTGIGWDAIEIFMIPINMILGHRELSPADGRIGPLFLILLPSTIFIFLTQLHGESATTRALRVIGVFSILSFAAWTVGVINSSMLWQVRFFYPALIPLAIPTALGWHALARLDSSQLRISFLMNTLAAVVVTSTILDNGIFVLQRNPLSVAFGAQSRERYIERTNPSYGALIQIMENLPPDARVYSLYEPRSYALPRATQPDLALYNLAHDLFLYDTPDAIIQEWKVRGYSHVLVYERGAELVFSSDTENNEVENTLDEVREKMRLVSQTPDKVYSMYQIPEPD